MPRVKRGTVRAAKRKKLLNQAKGYFLTKSKLYQSAQEAVMKAGQYAYAGRRRKKRDFRRLWVVRINAAARANGLTYGQLISGLKAAGVKAVYPPGTPMQEIIDFIREQAGSRSARA